MAHLARLNQRAGQLMADYIAAHGTVDTDALIAYAHALVTKYGEGSAELACQMYDALAAAARAGVPAAEPAEPASYGEIARMVQATKASPPQIQSGVSRLVKRAGADTTLKNALRDGAEFAWVPQADTCAFCLTLASRGWQKSSQAAIKDGHAEHIHANCDCEYAVRFDASTTVAGYDPEQYLAAYESAEGRTYQEKLNALRRAHYAENRKKITAQKRAAYATRKLSTIEDEDAKIKAIKDTMTKQVQALPESAREVLRAYTGFTATRVNFAIRHGSIPPQVQETIAALDNALASGTMPQSVMLYRNTALSFLDLGLPPKPTEQELQTIVRAQGTFPIFNAVQVS